MHQLIKDVVTILFLFTFAVPTWAASTDKICSGLSRYLNHPELAPLPNPARQPTTTEQDLIQRSNIELLSSTDYDMGVAIVDVDNDGIEDVFVWNVGGSGRFAVVQFFGISAKESGNADQLLDKGSTNNGVLLSPYFVRFQETNYLVSTDTGDQEGLSVSQIEKLQNGGYQMRTLCSMRTVVTADDRCKHPACKELQHQMTTQSLNDKFVSVEWPHKYFGPAGLATYFDDAEGDIDNIGESVTIWRLGREGYYYGYIYWHFLGIGEKKPSLDDQLLVDDGNMRGRHILSGAEHNRLRNVLRSQSVILSNKLHQKIALPQKGEFFLFQANRGRTYWAWDFGEAPFGAEIHVMYTKAERSDYIGVVRSARTSFLEPCTGNCITPLGH